MERKKRKVLFYLFIIAFVLGSIYLVVITQGLTIDWKHATITKTGAIYIRSTPSNPKIYIDNKEYTSEDGIITKGTLIKNLVPGTYEVRVEKDGFSSWTKHITVEKGVVSSESFVRLWKNSPKTEEVASTSIRDFWVTGAGVITQDESGKISIDSTTLGGIEVIGHSADTGTIITKDKEGNFFFIDAANPKTATNIREMFNSLKQRELRLPGVVNIVSVFPHPFSPYKTIVVTKTSVYIIDFKKIALEKILTFENIEKTFLNDTNVFVSDTEGNIATVNLLIKNDPQIVYTTSTEIHAPVLNNTYLLFLGEHNTLFAYDRATKNLVSLAKEVKSFSLSPEEKRVAMLFENGNLAIAYIADYSGNSLVEKGTVIPLTPNQKIGEKIESIEWLSAFPDHLALATKNTLWTIETDQRNPQNTLLLFKDVKKHVIQDDFYVLDIRGALKKITY